MVDSSISEVVRRFRDPRPQFLSPSENVWFSIFNLFFVAKLPHITFQLRNMEWRTQSRPFVFTMTDICMEIFLKEYERVNIPTLCQGNYEFSDGTYLLPPNSAAEKLLFFQAFILLGNVMF